MSDEGERVGTDQLSIEPVIATISLTARDLRAGIVESSLVYRIRWGFLIILLTMHGVARLGGGALYDDGGMAAGVQVLIMLFLFVTPWWTARNQLRRLIRAGDASATYRFDDEGVTLRSAGASGSISYRRIVKIRQGKKSLLLYSSDQVSEAIPLRAFSPAQLARIRAFLPLQTEPKPLRSGTRVAIFSFVLVLAGIVMWQFLSAQGTAPKVGTVNDPAGPK
jgi:hypothetical protein